MSGDWLSASLSVWDQGLSPRPLRGPVWTWSQHGGLRTVRLLLGPHARFLRDPPENRMLII